MDKMKKIADRLLILCFMGFLAAVLVLTVRNRHETYSFEENRSLAPRPTLTAEGVLDGSYFTGWDKFWIDRAVGRADVLKYRTLWQWQVEQRPVINDVLVLEDQLMYFFGPDSFRDREDPALQAAAVAAELEALRDHIAAHGGEFYYVGVPGQFTYLRDLAPDYVEKGEDYSARMHKAFFGELSERGVPFVNMMEVFEAAGHPRDFFLRTDHHYSFDGAWCTYQALMAAINAGDGPKLTVLGEEDVERVTLPNDFLGSWNRRLYHTYPSEERLTYAVPRKPVPFTREDNGQPSEPSVIALPGPEECATYGVYMGGDFGETIIRTDRPELPKVLIFGDSFTNALESLLYPSCGEMRSLDLRYYQGGKTLWEYIADYEPDIVITVREDHHFLDDGANNVFREK